MGGRGRLHRSSAFFHRFIRPATSIHQRNHRSMTKIIQLVGSLLGTVFGFGLGLLILERASGSISQANKPAFLVAIVVASLLFVYLAIPYVKIRPARWAVDRLAQAGGRGARRRGGGGGGGVGRVG